MDNTHIGELPVSLQALVTALIEERDEALAVLGAKDGETLKQAVQRTAVELHEARISDLRKAEDEAFLVRLSHVLTLEPLRESDLIILETRAETHTQRETIRRLSVVLEDHANEAERADNAEADHANEAERADNAEAELKHVRKTLFLMEKKQNELKRAIASLYPPHEAAEPTDAELIAEVDFSLACDPNDLRKVYRLGRAHGKARNGHP